MVSARDHEINHSMSNSGNNRFHDTRMYGQQKPQRMSRRENVDNSLTQHHHCQYQHQQKPQVGLSNQYLKPQHEQQYRRNYYDYPAPEAGGDVYHMIGGIVESQTDVSLDYAYGTENEYDYSSAYQEAGLPLDTRISCPNQIVSNASIREQYQPQNVYGTGNFRTISHQNSGNVTDFQTTGSYDYRFPEDFEGKFSEYYNGHNQYGQEQVQYSSIGGQWSDEVNQFDQQINNPNLFFEQIDNGYDYGTTSTLSPISPETRLSGTFPQPDIEAGSYYPIPSIDETVLSGTPITAISYDSQVAALYVATVTTTHASQNNTSFNNIQSRSRGRGLRDQNYRNGRATLMATYDIGTGMVYSIVESHPEAEAKTLQKIYETVYGTYVTKDRQNPSKSHNHAKLLPRIPNHAYKPCYGEVDPASAAANAVSSSAKIVSDGSDVFGNAGDYQMGVQAIIPVNDQGNVVSLSPSAVRLHTTGGLQLLDYEIEGMICGAPHPGSGSSNQSMTHVTVGGIAALTNNNSVSLAALPPRHSKHHVHCLDIWQGFRNVSSCTLSHATSASTQNVSSDELAVTALATCYSRCCVMAGCSDGTIRLLDGRGLRENAKYKSHHGGVVNMAVSEDGTLVATTGYGSLVSTYDSVNGLYAFPDTSVLIYDIRYMGRGGTNHAFSGLRGGPRFLSFVPSTFEDSTNSNCLLVASCQPGGGMQIVIPFQEESAISKSNFIVPQLKRGESISSLCTSEDCLALGTTQGKVLQFKLAGFDSTPPSLSANMTINQSGVFIPSITRRAQSGGSSISTLSRGASSRTAHEKTPLTVPPFHPLLPAVSLDANLLQVTDPNARNGTTEKMKNIISSYILVAEPKVSSIGNLRHRSISSFGSVALEPIVPQSRLQLSADLVKNAIQAADFLQTIPTTNLNIDLFEDHRTEHNAVPRGKTDSVLHQNPNKMIYTNKLFDLLYSKNLNRVKRHGRGIRNQSSGLSIDSIDDEAKLIDIPPRYRVRLRPSHLSASSFNHSELNKNGMLPGWDYRATMPNAFVSPVLMLLFCIPEIRSAVLDNQFTRQCRDINLVSELGYLFHRIEMISKLGMIFPTTENGSGQEGFVPKLDAWAPNSFISMLTTMPEAEQLQILDGSPAAVALPRRPEAFYRFILYQLDKEIGDAATKIIELLSGIDFVSVNQFVSGTGPDSRMTTKQLTIELSYDVFLNKNSSSEPNPYFGEVLQNSFCRAVELGAWNQVSKSYDTIIQRKILTSLPTVLSLAPECAGCKPEDGLFLFQKGNDDKGFWLPEIIEVELDSSGEVIVRQLEINEETRSETWHEFRNKESLPQSVSNAVKEMPMIRGPRKRRYRLDAVVSMIRDDMDKACPDEIRRGSGDLVFGHHVLHVRASNSLQMDVLKKQHEELKRYKAACDTNPDVVGMTLMGRKVDTQILQKRLDYINQRLNILESEVQESNKWILMNGFVVTDTVGEDARAFHVKFKEPSLLIFRSIDGAYAESKSYIKQSKSVSAVPVQAVRTLSITNGSRSIYEGNQKPANLPGKGSLIAFDAEFVSVQEEDSELTLSGSKVIIRETRHTLARISVVDGRTRSIIVDDHVQPVEPVCDYLTRFSGIVPDDLNPKLSRHHLISSRAAYLKLRCLVERGCIFIGHGLQQDFWTANLTVPSYQIIDTVHLYHKPAQRFISLRFLTNFVLSRDMQQDVHDSVEDAMAALELYDKAIELMQKGSFEAMLNDLYEFGKRTDWKLGIAGETN